MHVRTIGNDGRVGIRWSVWCTLAVLSFQIAANRKSLLVRFVECRFWSCHRSVLLLCRQWSTFPTQHHRSTRRSVDYLKTNLEPSGKCAGVWKHGFLAYTAPEPMCFRRWRCTAPRVHEVSFQVAVARFMVSLCRQSDFLSNVHLPRRSSRWCFVQSSTRFQAVKDC